MMIIALKFFALKFFGCAKNRGLSTGRTSCTPDKCLQTINVSGPEVSGYLGLRRIQEPSLVLEWKRRPKPNTL
jgi:hypothetical protein